MNKKSHHLHNKLGLITIYIFLAVLIVIQSQSIYSQTESYKLEKKNDSLIGVWQFPERKVWIYINNENNAFQCRIADGGTVIKSLGIVKDDKEISWEEIWGIDKISVQDDEITLDGKYGKFSYVKVETISGTLCLPPEKMESLDEPSSGFGNGGRSGSGVGNGDGLTSRPQIISKNNRIDTPIKILKIYPPGYTRNAIKNNVEGIVKLKIVFLSSGKIGSISIVQGLPHGLTQKAIEAARKLEFEPGKRDGQPISIVKTVIYNFNLY